MIHHTRGIVFNFIKYRETSIIVRIFTEAFGMQHYLVNGVRSPRSHGKIARYQPLTLLDMVVYRRPEKDLQRISEAKCSFPFKSIPFHPIKTGISLFLTEVLSKLLREESENRELFHFIHHAIRLFDHLEEHFSDFHLQFLLKCSAYLGFKLDSAGDFLEQVSPESHLSKPAGEKRWIGQLIDSPLGGSFHLSNTFRRTLLHDILAFYQIHTHALHEVKSLEILKEVLH